MLKQILLKTTFRKNPIVAVFLKVNKLDFFRDLPQTSRQMILFDVIIFQTTLSRCIGRKRDPVPSAVFKFMNSV